jgi:hypothetical protein
VVVVEVQIMVQVAVQVVFDQPLQQLVAEDR